MAKKKSKKSKRWIQSAIKEPGALRRQLGIKEGETIPARVLEKIQSAETGETISVDGKRVKVTTKLKRRAALAKTLKKLSKRKKKKKKK
jgi:hypothetical protein